MAKKEDLEKLAIRKQRQNRYFSEAFKKKKVNEIEKNLTTVLQVSREYEVSCTSVYKWIYKYSQHMKKGVKQVVEAQSDTYKLQQYRQQVHELERIVGQKQLQIDFLEKVIALAEEEYGFDLKKKGSSRPYSGTGSTKTNIPTK